MELSRCEWESLIIYLEPLKINLYTTVGYGAYLCINTANNVFHKNVDVLLCERKLQQHLQKGPFPSAVNTRLVVVGEEWCVWHFVFVTAEGGVKE